MKRLPVIIERTRKQVRAIAFKTTAMTSAFEQAYTYEFESQNFAEQNQELNNFIREKYFEAPGFYVNIPFEEIIIRELTLPFITKAKIRELLPFELESLLPYEISEIYYDYHIYPDPAQNMSRIVVCACRKSFLDPYVEFFASNGFLLRGFYIPIDSIVQLSGLGKESPEAILYMTSSFSSLVVLSEGAWLYSRIIPVGYDTLFAGLSGMWKKDIPESRKLLTEIPVSDSDIVDSGYYQSKFKLSKAKASEFVETLLDFSAKINREVKTTLRRAETSGEIRRISLMSDLDNQVFLENILAEKMSLEIVPFPYGSTPVSVVGRNYLIPVGTSYAVSSGSFMNLLSSALKKRFKAKKGATFSTTYIVIGLSLLLFGASFIVNGFHKKKQYDLVLERRQQLFAHLFGKAPDDVTSLISQANRLLEEQKKRSELYQLQANKYKLSQILYELNQSLIKSRDIQVERFVYTNNIVNMIASTSDFNELNNIKGYLLDNPVFDEVEVKDQKSYLGPGGANRVRFSLIVKPRVREE